MNILQINKFYYVRGGAERHFFDLSRVLKEHGQNVSHLSMLSDENIATIYPRYFTPEVDVNRFSLQDTARIFYNKAAVQKVAEAVAAEKPDIAHLHNIYYHLSPAIIKALKKLKVPVVMTLHDYKVICPNYQLYTENAFCQRCFGGKYDNCFSHCCVKNSYAKSFLAMMEAYVNNSILKYYRDVDLFIAPSQFMKDMCVAAGMHPDKIKVLYNFVKTEGTEVKKPQGKYLLYFGRLAKEKGIETLIEAMQHVSDFTLKIVGEGPDQENLENLILELGLEDKIEMTGYLSGYKLQETIDQAAAVIMPSVWPENMPLSLLESLAKGKVVIASRVGGMPEVITGGVNGFLFNPKSSFDLAEKINNLGQLDLQTIGQKAIKSVTGLNEEAYYKEIVEVYRGIIRNNQ